MAQSHAFLAANLSTIYKKCTRSLYIMRDFMPENQALFATNTPYHKKIVFIVGGFAKKTYLCQVNFLEKKQ